MRQQSEQDEVVDLKPIYGTLLSQDWEGIEDEDYEPSDPTKEREGIERLNALLASLPPIKVL